MTNIPQTVAMFVLTLIIGSCVSISSTVQTLIISQAVDLEEKISGNRPDALFFSAQTFIVKIGTGLSSLAASIGYAAVKFSSSETAALNDYCKRRNPEARRQIFKSDDASVHAVYSARCAEFASVCNSVYSRGAGLKN